MTANTNGYSYDITLQIIDKLENKIIQTIHLDSANIEESCFKNCSAVKSYVTGINENEYAFNKKSPTPGYCGDLIVADFNFDGKEDFAVIYGQGACCTTYKYFIQTASANFVEDNFLNEEMSSFPVIDEKNRSIKQNYVYHKGKAPRYWTATEYQFDITSQKWTKKDVIVTQPLDLRNLIYELR